LLYHNFFFIGKQAHAFAVAIRTRRYEIRHHPETSALNCLSIHQNRGFLLGVVLLVSYPFIPPFEPLSSLLPGFRVFVCHLNHCFRCLLWCFQGCLHLRHHFVDPHWYVKLGLSYSICCDGICVFILKWSLLV